VTFRNKIIFYGELLAPRWRTTPCPRLLIQFIRSYPPYLEAVSIRNLRTRHAAVIRDPLKGTGWGGMDWIDLTQDRDQWWALVNTVMNLPGP
jgi:hypothetical protein